jgi:hypothetical protein
MATTLQAFLDKQWISDFLKWEQDQRVSRKLVTIGVSQTLVKGQVLANSGAGIDDVQVFTLAGTVASGTFKFQYGDNPALKTSAITGLGVTAATIQTALRALGASAGDAALAACTVALSVAAAGVDTAVYTVTCTTQYVPPLQVTDNGMLTSGSVACTLGSSGQAPGTSSTSTDPNYAAATILNVGAHTLGASPNNYVVLPAAVTDSQTLSLSGGTDGGYFAVFYKGQVTAPQAYNVSASNLQVALRALHADLAACSVSLANEVYTITTAGVACDDIAVVSDSTTDGGVFEGGITCAHGTQGVAVGQGACAVLLQDITTSASVPKQALVAARYCVVDADKLSFGANVTTDAQEAAILASLDANHGIIARREATTQTVQYT